MPASAEFLDALRSADLDQYYLNFTMRGVTSLDMLSSLPLQEYAKYGITSTDDRKRLFALISLLKQTQLNNSSGAQSQHQHRTNASMNVFGSQQQQQQQHVESSSSSSSHKASSGRNDISAMAPPAKIGRKGLQGFVLFFVLCNCDRRLTNVPIIIARCSSSNQGSRSGGAIRFLCFV